MSPADLLTRLLIVPDDGVPYVAWEVLPDGLAADLRAWLAAAAPKTGANARGVRRCRMGKDCRTCGHADLSDASCALMSNHSHPFGVGAWAHLHLCDDLVTAKRGAPDCPGHVDDDRVTATPEPPEADPRLLAMANGKLADQLAAARADLDALSRAVGQAMVAATLQPGESLANPMPHAIVGLVTRLRAEALGQRADNAMLVVEVERLREDVARLTSERDSARKRADETEARCDGMDERLHTADMPWRLPGCQCPSDSKPGDRCDSRWTRCNARLQYQRAVKLSGGP